MPRKVAKAKDVGVDKEKSVGKKDVVKRGRKMRGGKLNIKLQEILSNKPINYDDVFEKINAEFTKIKPTLDEMRKRISFKFRINDAKDKHDKHIAQIDKFKSKKIKEIPNLLDLLELCKYINIIGTTDDGYNKEILYRNIIILYIYNFFELIKDIIENNNVDIDIDDKVALPVVDNTKDKAIEELATATTAKDKAIEELATATTAKDKAIEELATATTAKDKAERVLAEEKKAKEEANTKLAAANVATDAVKAELAAEKEAKKAVEAEFAATQKQLKSNIITIDKKYFSSAFLKAELKYNEGLYDDAKEILTNITAIWEMLKNDEIKKIMENDVIILKAKIDNQRTNSHGGGKRKINSSRTKRK